MQFDSQTSLLRRTRRVKAKKKNTQCQTKEIVTQSTMKKTNLVSLANPKKYKSMDKHAQNSRQ